MRTGRVQGGPASNGAVGSREATEAAGPGCGQRRKDTAAQERKFWADQDSSVQRQALEIAAAAADQRSFTAHSTEGGAG